MSSRAIRDLVRSFVTVLAACALAGTAHAQEFRASIVGRVMDTTGGALPGVVVSAKNDATNVVATSTSNGQGDYYLMYLAPGTYTVTAEIAGFKRLSQPAVELRIGDRVNLPLTLAPGGQTETVEVVAHTPLLETETASAGQVIDAQRIALMPLADGNPFVLGRLASGISYTGDLLFSRAFDNNATAAVRVNGSSGRNEFTLDGVPNMAIGNGTGDRGRVGFVPPSDAVEEFKVETSSFDAQQGHTAGGNFNVTIKSGTNRFSGTVYEYNRDDKFAAQDFFDKKAGKKNAPLSYNRFGATLGGPLRQDKTFFFAAVEGLKDEFPEPATYTVPTEAQRNGDFSELLAQGVQIYDPLSGTKGSDGKVVRQPFPGNIIPAGRISPIAKALLGLYPQPNQAADADGRRNYRASPNARADKFYSVVLRVDHSLSPTQKVFARYAGNNREETRNFYFGETNGIAPVGNTLKRVNNNATIDYVNTMNASTLLNVRAGYTRWHEANVRGSQGLDLASLGFSRQARRPGVRRRAVSADDRPRRLRGPRQRRRATTRSPPSTRCSRPSPR